MKKYSFFLIIVSLLTNLTSCDKNHESLNNSNLEKPSNAVTQAVQVATQAMIRTEGEFISISTDNAPRKTILANLTETTGTKIQWLDLPTSAWENEKLSLDLDNVSYARALNILLGKNINQLPMTIVYKPGTFAFPSQVLIGQDILAVMTRCTDTINSISRDNQIIVMPTSTNPAVITKAYETARTVMEMTPEDQIDAIGQMDANNPEDLQAMTELMRSNLPKQSKLDLIHGITFVTDHEKCRAGLYIAIQDSDPEIASTAINEFNFYGKKSDIAALKTAMDLSTDPNIKELAQETIDFITSKSE